MQLGIDQVYDVRVSRTSTGLDIYTNDVVTIYDTAYSDVLTVFHDLDTFIHGYEQLCAIRDAMYRFPNNPALEYLFGADFREKYGLEDDNQSTSSDSSSDKKDDDKKDDKKDDSKDKSLWQRFCDFIKRIWQKIKDFFSGTKTEKKEDDKTPATNEPINKILDGVSKQEVPKDIQERVKKLDNEDEKNWFVIFYNNVKTGNNEIDPKATDNEWAKIREKPAKHINPELIVKIKDWSTKIVSLLCDEKMVRAIADNKISTKEELAEFVGVKPLEKYINNNQSLKLGDVPSGTAWDEVKNLRKYQSDLEHLLKSGWAATMEKEIEKVIPSNIGDGQIVSAWKRIMGNTPFNTKSYMQTVRSVLQLMVTTVSEFQQAIKNYEVVTAIVKGAEVYKKLKNIEEKADKEEKAKQDKAVNENVEAETKRQEDLKKDQQTVDEATQGDSGGSSNKGGNNNTTGTPKKLTLKNNKSNQSSTGTTKKLTIKNRAKPLGEDDKQKILKKLLSNNKYTRNAGVANIQQHLDQYVVPFSPDDRTKLLGGGLSEDEIKEILKKYNLTNLFSLFEEDTTDMTTWW